jgi:hypothetical protein
MAAIAETVRESATESNPEVGVIAMGDVTLSEVEYWRDGPLHVFRSTEFDVIAADEDQRAAVLKFVANAEDLADSISDLARDEITQHEAEVAIKIMERQRDAYRALNDRINASLRRRRRLVRLLRGRGNDAARPWYRQSSLRTSSPLPPV